MSRIEVRTKPSYKWGLTLTALGCMVFVYFYVGYLPALWVIGGLVGLIFLYKAVRGESKGPCIVLDDKGVLDRGCNQSDESPVTYHRLRVDLR